MPVPNWSKSWKRLGSLKLVVQKIWVPMMMFSSLAIPTNHPSKRPSGVFGTVPQDTTPELPPVYGIIRASKFKKLGAGSFGKFLAWNRTAARAKVGYGSGGLAVPVPDDARPFLFSAGGGGGPIVFILLDQNFPATCSPPVAVTARWSSEGRAVSVPSAK